MSRLSLTLAVFGVLVACLRAAAGDLPAAAAPAAAGASHAWVALPIPSGGSAIVHLPRQGATGVGPDSDDGSVRLATRVPSRPERLAAWDATLYIAFPAEELGGGKKHRRVVSLSAERGAIGGTWVSDTDARLPALPSLPGDGSFDGFVGTSTGPAALLRDRDPARRSYRLLMFVGSEWTEINLPDRWSGSPDLAGSLGLATSPDGIAVVVLGGDSPGLWTAELPRHPSEGVRPTLEWRFRALSFDGPGGRTAPAPQSPLYLVAGHLVYVSRTRDGRTAEVWSPSEAQCHLLQRVREIGEDLAVVSLDQPGRLALMWQEYPDEPPSRPGSKRAPPDPTTRLVEVSASSGQILYDGPAKVGPPISQEELKILAVVLVAVMAVVLLFVLKPESQVPPLTLPEGVSLAEPGRRLVAALIDVAAAALITSRLTRTPALELLTPTNLLHDPASLEAILMMLGIGWLHSTAGEWLFGRSLGKALTGCEVVHATVSKAEDGAVTVTLQRPRLWRAAVRNLVRWALPPLAMSGLSGMDHRHRGDTAAGTVVVVRDDEPE